MKLFSMEHNLNYRHDFAINVLICHKHMYLIQKHRKDMMHSMCA